MDLESESSLLESVDDNSVTQQSGMDNGSLSDESVKLLSISKVDEVSRQVSFETPVSKGRGLRKWRRIKRDLVKDTSGGMENSKVLKRELSGLNGKQIQFRSSDVEQGSQGSVGSVNMLENSCEGFDGSRFVAGIDLEKDDDRSSKSSKVARAPKVFRFEKPMVSSGQRGEVRVENSKKQRGESVELEKENSRSSLESDLRKESGRLDYNGDNKGDTNGETSNKREDAGGEGEDSIDQNSLYSEEYDLLAEAIDSFLTLQEALEKEVKQLSEIGKEPIYHEGANKVSSPCSEIVTLVNNVEQLETKLEETRSMLEEKEAHIRELESTTNQNQHARGGRETVVEDIFRQRIESEIEYLIYSRSIDNLNSQMTSIEEQEALAEEEAHETLSKLGEVETKAANLTNRAKDLQQECREINGTIKKSACKTTSYLVIQLALLVTVVLLFMSQLLPESDIVVVPT